MRTPKTKTLEFVQITFLDLKQKIEKQNPSMQLEMSVVIHNNTYTAAFVLSHRAGAFEDVYSTTIPGLLTRVQDEFGKFFIRQLGLFSDEEV
jgi:hypothetical protein